jgi:4-amino-4-deoxy-L-arabinose transferase-like glycosyltransferase
MLGYLVIVITLVARLIYLASGKIELSEDEAYQWIWSKHLALSYFSKPPFIAYAQFLGTSIWGDNEFGVRFLSPCIAAAIGLILLRFVARVANARAAFWLVVLLQCVPLLAVGATLMTIDPLLVLFWTCGMVAGWRAVQPDAKVRDWVWVGVAIGAGFLSKYSAAYQIICLLIFLLAWPPARQKLRTPGPYLALLLVIFATIPVVLWNYQHGWITVKHVSQNAGLDKVWQPTLRYFWDFVGAELGLLNPILLVGSVWAWIAFWKRRSANPPLLYLFCMGAPVLIGHLLYTLHSRVFPNWIAPAVTPTLCFLVIFREQRWSDGVKSIKLWLIAAIVIGVGPIILLHDTNLVQKLAGYTLPAKIDPLRRVRAWRETARVVAEARESFQREGKEVFIVAAHYGLVGQLTFYTPEARAKVKHDPYIFYQSAERPENQFYFWPGYTVRKGQNAIFVQEQKLGSATAEKLPPVIEREFESIQDLGLRQVEYRGRIFRTLHLYACRNLR